MCPLFPWPLGPVVDGWLVCALKVVGAAGVRTIATKWLDSSSFPEIRAQGSPFFFTPAASLMEQQVVPPFACWKRVGMPGIDRRSPLQVWLEQGSRPGSGPLEIWGSTFGVVQGRLKTRGSSFWGTEPKSDWGIGVIQKWNPALNFNGEPT